MLYYYYYSNQIYVLVYSLETTEYNPIIVEA